MENQPAAATRRGHRKLMVGTLLTLLLLAMGASGLLYVQYRHAVLSNPNRERQRITQTIGGVVNLPKEEPVLTTVVDKSKLTNETLQLRSENGDKLLIYAKAKRLIIYRPSLRKVIDILSIQGKQVPATNSPATTQKPVEPSATR